MKKFSIDYNIDTKWIFLESGHGKGVADAVGAAIKRKFDETVTFNPDGVFSNAADLIDYSRRNTDIKLYSFNSTNIANVRKQIPRLETVKGTATFHELIATKDGRFYAKTVPNEKEKLLTLRF